MPKKYLPNQDDAREQLMAAKYGLATMRPEYPPVPRPGFDGRAITPAVPGVASSGIATPKSEKK